MATSYKSHPEEAEELARQRNAAGWFNYCPACQGRYWVRASDTQATKARRFIGPESNDLHRCAP